MPNIYTHILSGTLFLISFKILHNFGAGKANKFIFSLLAFFYVFLFAIYEVADYFTGIGIDQATIIQLKFGLGGAAVGAYKSLIGVTSGVLFVSAVLLTLFVFRVQTKKDKSKVTSGFFAYTLLIIAVVFNPAAINLYALPTGTFISSRASSASAVSEFYKYYKKPRLREVSDEHKNIIFIYAESLERAFFNENIFPDLVPKLKKLEQQSISFTNMNMAHGTGGTIWAISASQCGLPLFLPNLTILNKGTGEFLPAATCLGDLLEDEGYYLTYYGGASLEFTGKGNFFNSHGFKDIFGKHELLSLLENKEYQSFWGVYDDSLFDISYKRFLELSAKDEKFGLFLLTVDTHSPGYASKSCEDIPYKDGANKHLNSIACADHLISEFVDRIAESPYASQTVILLASDHLNWNDAPTADLLKKARNGEKNIFMIIEPGVNKGKKEDVRGTAFDIGATILPFIGYTGQIGLGRDLLANNDEKNVKERAYIQTRLYAWKTEILKFWGQPKIRKSLSIDISKRKVSIDKTEYKVPIFIELSDTLDTALLFGFNNGFEKYLKTMDKNKKFILVGSCSHIKTVEKRISKKEGIAMGKNGLCVIAGDKNEFFYKEKLDNNIRYNISQLHNMLGMRSSSPEVSKTQ